MREPEIALVFSPEQWFEELHRHLTDHGGARVRQVVMDPALALAEEYGTLVVSHRWPALTRRFVDDVHDRKRTILGVYSPSEPAACQFLAALGIDGVVANDASMPAFLEALTALHATADAAGSGREADGTPGLDAGAQHDETTGAADRPADLVVVGGTPGAGRTEVALTLAAALARRGEGVLLVDADEVGPSLAQRLGTPIEPNLRTAIEAVEHGAVDPERCALALAPVLDLLGGLPNAALWSQIRPREVVDVIRVLSSERRWVIADIASSTEELDAGGRGRFGIARATLAEAATVVGVGLATPVGVSRLLGWVAAVRLLNPEAPVHLVVNRSDRSSFREAEIDREVRRTFAPASLTFLPEDRRVDVATWSAEVVVHGLFARGIGRLAAESFPALACAGSRRRAARAGARAVAS